MEHVYIDLSERDYGLIFITNEMLENNFLKDNKIVTLEQVEHIGELKKFLQDNLYQRYEPIEFPYEKDVSSAIAFYESDLGIDELEGYFGEFNDY